MIKKKIAVIALAAVMTCALCACGNDSSAESSAASAESSAASESSASAETTGMENPMVAHDSLEEINELTGGRLCQPATMGVSDEAYYIIDTDPQIAEYDFTVNGIPYSFRFSSDFENDISGIYGDDGNTVFSDAEGETLYYDDGADIKSACCFTVDGQYVLTAAESSSIDMDTFKGIADEMFSMVVPEESDGDSEDVSEYTGTWYETIAGRGSIVVTEDNGTLNFAVTWPNSAAEVIETSFSGTVEDGVLSYTNGVSKSLVYGSDGKVSSEESLYEDGTGTVTFNEDGTFTWVEDGNNEEGSVFALDK